MRKVKKGDIVGRISYEKDIIFTVERIIRRKDREIAILKGITVRIQADSPIDDLELMQPKKAEEQLRNLDKYVEKRIKEQEKSIEIYNEDSRENIIVHTGRILHIDGDRKYSEKSNMYYKKIGLNAIVRNVPERRQPNVIGSLIKRYKPEILVITGHDRDDKKGNKI